MSQLQQELQDDAAIADRLRPEEDPWSSLAVSQDDVLADDGIPSPAFGGPGAATDEDDDDDVDAPLRRDDDVPMADAAPAPAARRFPDAAPDSEPDIQEVDEDDEHRAAPAFAAEPDEEAEFDDDGAAVLTMVDPAIEPTRGGGFTIPMVCAGVAIIACCLLIPQADANRRAAYQQAKLRADLEAVERQVAVNDEFLRKVADDPNLAERLAQRQMKIIRPGTKVLVLKGAGEAEMSPFQITAVAAPPKLAPYKPLGGTLAQLCYNPKSRLYLMGVGLLLTAVGLVLGFGARSPD